VAANDGIRNFRVFKNPHGFPQPFIDLFHSTLHPRPKLLTRYREFNHSINLHSPLITEGRPSRSTAFAARLPLRDFD
jgi:hypothetical protein